MPDPPLHLIQIQLDVRGLIELGRRRALPLRQTDLDYLVHCAFGELFGDEAPSPFRSVGNSGSRLEVLAYSRSPGESLAHRAKTYAEPTVWSTADWTTFASKPMPSDWKEGQRLGFEIRVCPVVRKSSEGEKHRAGAEVDAFLSRAWDLPDEELNRETVYKAWLEERLSDRGVRLLDHRLERFQLSQVIRRRQGSTRTSAVIQRPDATLRGLLEVADAERLHELLGRGVGRHRAFGFGMLLLRSPRSR